MRALVLALALAAGWPATVAAQEFSGLDPNNVLTWPRAPVDRLGCMLERAFDMRDARFNCALRNYVNRGNACTQLDTYYEGPVFVAGMASKVSPEFDRLQLAHVGGRLQAVTLVLKQRRTSTAIAALLGLPPPGMAPPTNISRIDIQGCRAEGPGEVCNVVLIEGFDHVGAGEANCGDEGERPEPTPQPAGSSGSD